MEPLNIASLLTPNFLKVLLAGCANSHPDHQIQGTLGKVLYDFLASSGKTGTLRVLGEMGS
jgi:hypothetical protein